jgi:putative intracellular protease/amidase
VPGCGELGRPWVLAERAVADPPAAAESSRRCHQLQQQVDAAATVIAALCAGNTALREGTLLTGHSYSSGALFALRVRGVLERRRAVLLARPSK